MVAISADNQSWASPPTVSKRCPADAIAVVAKTTRTQQCFPSDVISILLTQPASPLGPYLEHRTLRSGTSTACRTTQIPGWVENEATVTLVSVQATSEPVQHAFPPFAV